MPLDYLAITEAGRRAVPDLRLQLMQDEAAAMQREQFGWQRQAMEQAQRQAAREAEQQVAYQGALEQALLSNDPQDILRLIARFPAMADSIKPLWEALDDEQRQADLTQTGTMYARAQAGDIDGTISLLEQRLSADRQAGASDPADEAILAGLRSTNPVERNAAIATIGIQLAALTGDKFSETYGRLNPAENKPGIQREAEYYRSIGRDDLAEQVLVNNADPLVQVTTSAGTDIRPRSDYTGPAQPRVGDPTAVAPEGAAIEAAAVAAVPGVGVTSRRRSPERNHAVGGTANSYHLTDQARDFTPPAGMPMGQLAARLKRAFPGFDVINEGDHVHVEPGPGMSGGPVTVRTVQQANALPPGTRYTTPDGREFVR